MEQQVPLQRLHHVVHAGESRFARIQAEAVVLHDPRRGAHDQELQVAAVEHSSYVSLVPPPLAHRDPTAEQSDGAVGAVAVLDVGDGFCELEGVWGVVCE